jgi:hypothetical protein
MSKNWFGPDATSFYGPDRGADIFATVGAVATGRAGTTPLQATAVRGATSTDLTVWTSASCRNQLAALRMQSASSRQVLGWPASCRLK